MKIYLYDILPFETSTLLKLQEENPQDEIIMSQDNFNMTTLEKAKDCDAISILGNSQVSAQALHKMKEYGINHISTRTIGYDHIDMPTAKELGINVYNAFYNPNNVADFTVMMMLIMLRKAKISICRALVNDFSLDGMMGREMHNLTIGIIGTGKIGSCVIKNLSGFGCRVIAYARHKNPDLEKYCEYVDLDTLYRESDIISLHVPLTPENYHMINKETFTKMKKGLILINTARGQLIDTEDLIEALETEQVGGAGIDTLEEEKGFMHVDVGTKISDNRSLMYLKQFPNVLYTQHYAFYTQEACESMVRCGVNSLQAGFRGEKTPCQVFI